MDRQQFDHIENKIRQAADQISVPFSEEAWKKMEVKLDNEFNKDRRRGIIWWWFSFIIIGLAALGIYLYNAHPHASGKEGQDVSSTLNNQPAKLSTGKKEDSKVILPEDRSKEILSTTNKPTDTKATNQSTRKNLFLEDASQSRKETSTISKTIPAEQKENSGEVKQHAEVVTKNISVFKSSSPVRKRLVKVINSIGSEDQTKTVISRATNKNARQSPLNEKGIKAKGAHTPGLFPGLADSENVNRLTAKKDDKNEKVVSQDSSIKVDHSTGAKVVRDSIPATASEGMIEPSQPLNKKDNVTSIDSVAKKKIPVKLTVQSARGIYFLASVAGEATGIKKISIKDTKPIYGFGVGYRFNNRLSAQTGFYVGKKVYYAGAGDYKVKPGSYIAKFISAEADCYIYDIPLNLRYDAVKKSTSNLYFITGLSTYILKRETYVMRFYNPMGAYRHMPYTYKNNVGYFSVLNFSLGYEHKLSNSLFIQAEPYLKLPLAGLGEGDAKLFSAGLQLGIKYQPLKKTK